MSVHRIQSVPSKFKQGKNSASTPAAVPHRIQQMKDRREAAQQIGKARDK